MKLHQHQIVDLDDCNLKLYLKHIVKGVEDESRHVKALFGTAVHNVTDLLHQDKDLFANPDDIVSIMLHSAIDEEENKREYKWTDRKKELAVFVDDYSKAISNYCRAPWNRDFEMLYYESSWEMELGVHNLLFKIYTNPF